MSMRKNVSLPDRYEEYYEMLEESGVFEEEFGNFSGFVQAMIERLAEDKPELLHDHVKGKEEELRRKREKLEDEFDLNKSSDEGDIEEQKIDFFESMLDALNRIKDKDQDIEQVYSNVEDLWMKKYRKNFHHVNKKSFRNELESVLGEKGVTLGVTN